MNKMVVVAAVLGLAMSVMADGPLTPQNQVVEKNVNFSQPTVVRFTWSGNMSSDSWLYASFETKCSMDGIDCRQIFYHWDYLYSGLQWNESMAAVMYVPAGQHVLRWEFSRLEVWGDGLLEVAITGYSEEPMAKKESFYDWCKPLAENRIWIPDNLEYIRGKQSALIAANPDDYETRINRAFTTLSLLGENTTLRELLGQFGFTLPDFYISQPQGEFCGLENAPTSANVADIVLPQALAAIDGALADIDAIPENWAGNILLDTAKYPALPESVYIDRAEVSVVRATLRAGRAFVQLAQGYDFEADYLAVSNAWATCPTIDDIRASMPKVGLVRDLEKMSAAKEDFRAALNCLKKADEAIVARDDALKHFIEYDEADAEDIVHARIMMDAAIESLDKETTADGTYFAEKYIPYEALPNGFVRQIYLGAIFAGHVTRDCIGPIMQEKYEYQVDGVNLNEMFPDPTFGGVAPDVTIEEIAAAYTGKQIWSIDDYLSIAPRVKFRGMESFVVEGTAAITGDVSFNLSNGGSAFCLIDGQPVDNQAVSGSGSFPVEKGHEYAVVYVNAESIDEPTKLITFTSVPSPLPDGGPYTEEVDRVDWEFTVENGEATVGCREGSSYAGDLTVPAILGGRPVTGIAKNGFMARSNITSITLPATINSIGDNAFFYCGANSITFLGNEPKEVGSAAFSQLPAGFAVYATHAADWSGVTIPGTWNGMPISYVAAYNPALVATANKTSGDFSIQTTLELAAGDGCTIRYTTDGSVPTAKSSAYSEPLVITATTTVTYLAFDGNGDWGPVGSVTLTRVPAQSDSVVVTPSVEDGTRFVGSQYVTISAAAGSSVYYTTDGSDPMTSTTRRKYTGSIYMSGTTTLKYYAVDANGDWSPVQTAQYTCRNADGYGYTQTVDGITFYFTVSNGCAIVERKSTSSFSGYSGKKDGFYYGQAISTSTAGSLTIPSELGGCPVTGIGYDAFYYCTGLTSVTIPDGVTSIGDSAFYYCTGLTGVTIPDGVTSIGDYAFCYTGLTSVTIPDSVISIGHCAFNMTKITELKLPEGLQYMGETIYFMDGLDDIWSKKYNAELMRMAQKSMNGTLNENPRYDISDSAGDRKIASITVSEDTALDDFVLPSGKVYDSVIYITNAANSGIKVTMPDGHVYKTLKWMRPLNIPANSSHILTITRIADNTFLLSRQELETVQ